MKKILAFVSVFLTGTFTMGQSAEEYSEMAESKIEQGNYQYAMVLIEKAIIKNDTNLAYYFKKAKIQFELTGPLDAINILKYAISINSENQEVYNRLGIYYKSAGMADSAIIMYDQAIYYAKNDSSKYDYILNRGSAKASKQDFDEAIKDYERVLNFNPEHIAALNNISRVYQQNGMFEKSIECLEKIISIDDSIIWSYVNLGFIYSKLENFDVAIEYFDKAAIIDPNEALIYSNRGYAYFKKLNYSKAIEDINLSLKLYPTNSYAYRNLALVYIAMDKISEACNALNFANKYGFEKRYGSEVMDLMNDYCE